MHMLQFSHLFTIHNVHNQKKLLSLQVSILLLLYERISRCINSVGAKNAIITLKVGGSKVRVYTSTAEFYKRSKGVLGYEDKGYGV